MDKEHFYKIQVSRHGKDRQALFSRARVGIAGLGGLGSHVAVMLARLGVGTLVLADFDIVDETNIHRQQYDLADIGRPKTQALRDRLMRINPYVEYCLFQEKIVPGSVQKIFGGCSVICEAFDRADQKAMLAETVLCTMPDTYLVGGNGMAGTESANLMHVHNPMKRYYVCGDGVSDVADSCLFAPRVTLCAAMQATQIMRLLLNEETI